MKFNALQFVKDFNIEYDTKGNIRKEECFSASSDIEKEGELENIMNRIMKDYRNFERNHNKEKIKCI